MSRRFKTNDSDEDDDIESPAPDDNNNQEKRKSRLFNYNKGLKRAKKAVISPFNKVHKLVKTCTRSCSSSSSTSTSFVHKKITSNLSSIITDDTARRRRIGNFACFACLSKTQTLDDDTIGSDENDPNVNYETLKTLIEKNDFYSKECNTHLAV